MFNSRELQYVLPGNWRMSSFVSTNAVWKNPFLETLEHLVIFDDGNADSAQFHLSADSAQFHLKGRRVTWEAHLTLES